MDNFDDLLGQSRAALEENPFADDPFSRPLSGSPDPWATPFGAADSADAFGSTASHFVAADSFASHTNAFETPITGHSEATHSDPLDSVVNHIVKDDGDNEPSDAKLLSPGFRESVSIPITTTDTRVPVDLDDVKVPPSSVEGADNRPSTHHEASESDSSPSKREKTNQLYIPEGLKTPSKSGSSFASFQTATSTLPFKPPLDLTPSSALERSIAGLSIGGEAVGGWHTEAQTSWHQSEATAVVPPSPALPAPPADEDSDDDKPILQALQEKQQQQKEASIKKDKKGLQPVFMITVEDPQKVGDPIRSFTMYTVHTRTTSPLFQKSSFSVLRRYSDFLWFYETLSANNPGVVVPPVPEKNPFGRFDDQFVKQRRQALEKCIQKIANHPVLMNDPDLKFFLESDNFALDMKHRKAELAQERGGIIASIGQTIAGPRFYENDEWFDRQKGYLDSLESQLRGLVKAIEMVARHRQELSIATGEFAHNVGDLASSDVGNQLAQSLAGLAEVERKVQDLQAAQADQDMGTLMATADEYARLINSVRLAFNSRIRVYYLWKSAENDLLRTKQAHEKNRAQGRIPPDRLGYSLSLIAESERRASEAKLEFEQVSKLVKTEVARFEQERIQDFKDSLQIFLEGMILRQRELISAWEAYQRMLLKKAGGSGPTSVQDSESSHG